MPSRRRRPRRRRTADTTIVFVDEVHRFNKSQQDAFLPFVEQGLVTFIGATTENPVLRSQLGAAVARQVYVLQSLQTEELASCLQRAQGAAAGVPERCGARERLIALCRRRCATSAECAGTVASLAARDRRGHTDRRSVSRQALAQSLRRFDKGGEAVLRPDLRPAQIGARLQSRCRAVLAGAHARWRCRSRAIWRGASCAWRGRTSAWPTRARSQLTLDAAADLRAARFARRRVGAGAGGDLHGHGAQVERGLCRV